MLRVVVVVLLVACGDNKPPITLAEYPEARRDAWCEWYVQCGYLPNVETCVGLFRAFVDPDIAAAVEANLVVFHPDVAYRCIEWIESRGCDPTTAEFREPACFGIYAGTLLDGELCAFGYECISGECFHDTEQAQCEESCCRGTCTGNMPPTLGRVGDRCRYSDCIDSLCDGNVCLAWKPEGATCTYADECEIGLTCTGTCERLPGYGEPCTRRCREYGQTCSAETGRCERVKLGGETCWAETDCSAFYDCSADTRTTYSCHGRGGGLGASCDMWFARCTAPYVCDYAAPNAKCVEPKPDGAPCNWGEECASGSCTFNFGARVCTSQTCI